MKEIQKIAEEQHKVLIGITIMLVIILIMAILSIMNITKTMKEKDQIIEEIETKINNIEREKSK